MCKTDTKLWPHKSLGSIFHHNTGKQLKSMTYSTTAPIWPELFPHSSVQKNDNRKYKRNKLQRLFFKWVISGIIFMKIYNLKKDKSLCQSTFFICSTKMLILLSFTIVQCSAHYLRQHNTDRVSELNGWFCFNISTHLAKLDLWQLPKVLYTCQLPPEYRTLMGFTKVKQAEGSVHSDKVSR